MENNRIMVDVNHVTISFNLSSQKVDNLKEYMIKLVKHELMFQEFWRSMMSPFKYALAKPGA